MHLKAVHSQPPLDPATTVSPDGEFAQEPLSVVYQVEDMKLSAQPAYIQLLFQEMPYVVVAPT